MWLFNSGRPSRPARATVPRGPAIVATADGAMPVRVISHNYNSAARKKGFTVSTIVITSG